MDGGSFTSIATVIKLVEFGLALQNASQENRIFIELIDGVRHDVEEAVRLRNSPKVVPHLKAIPKKLDWVDRTIFNARAALNDIGQFVEGIRIDEEKDGKATMYQRFKWVFTNHAKMTERQRKLETCHISLSTAMNMMNTVEVHGERAAASDPRGLSLGLMPEIPPPRYSEVVSIELGDEKIRPPRSRRRRTVNDSANSDARSITSIDSDTTLNESANIHPELWRGQSWPNNHPTIPEIRVQNGFYPEGSGPSTSSLDLGDVGKGPQVPRKISIEAEPGVFELPGDQIQRPAQTSSPFPTKMGDPIGPASDQRAPYMPYTHSRSTSDLTGLLDERSFPYQPYSPATSTSSLTTFRYNSSAFSPSASSTSLQSVEPRSRTVSPLAANELRRLRSDQSLISAVSYLTLDSSTALHAVVEEQPGLEVVPPSGLEVYTPELQTHSAPGTPRMAPISEIAYPANAVELAAPNRPAEVNRRPSAMSERARKRRNNFEKSDYSAFG